MIVYPCWYSGTHLENEWLIGPTMALDPEKYFIIVPNMFGNGLSTSASNTPAPFNGSRFPKITAYDNVVQQHRLVTEKFGISKVKLVTGWSMGALQTFHWGAIFPDMVERILPFQGSAKCSRHNFVFLEGVKAALQADAAFMDGFYKEQPQKGLRAASRVYAGWGFSQTFYRVGHRPSEAGSALCIEPWRRWTPKMILNIGTVARCRGLRGRRGVKAIRATQSRLQPPALSPPLAAGLFFATHPMRSV